MNIADYYFKEFKRKKVEPYMNQKSRRVPTFRRGG